MVKAYGYGTYIAPNSAYLSVIRVSREWREVKERLR
jgi:hypothetical protein